ncbi:hypothetical protein [Patulibacter sp. SYSU D01012]|uniref:hypothetical protein n=1 Tax=Patulibacter sp. SYSU D01012 TaxID=2817381 RepID=UPI001B3120D4|nr:hypothetical protein [Patulibacter sp. SYSU D01012]
MTFFIAHGPDGRWPNRRVLAALSVTSMCVMAVAPTAALAGRSTLGLHHVEKSDGADVHRTSDRGFPNGQYIGHLDRGDGFRVKEVHGEWCGGSAGGSVDHDGWVLCKDLDSI